MKPRLNAQKHSQQLHTCSKHHHRHYLQSAAAAGSCMRNVVVRLPYHGIWALWKVGNAPGCLPSLSPSANLFAQDYYNANPTPTPNNLSPKPLRR